MARHLDLAAACEAFVAVAERESFTAGAAVAGITQSVASRRIAALEDHLGGRLFERSSRRVALTAFGRSVLPSAVKLVTAAQELVDDAVRSHQLPVTIAVPRGVHPRVAAAVSAAAAGASMTIEFLEGPPAERSEWFVTGRAQMVLQHVEPDRAHWATPLGVARLTHRSAAQEHPFFLAELRPRRGAADRRRIWLQPEDDVPNVRDRLEQVRNGAGLTPGHLRIAPSLVAAMARAMADDDLVLATRAEADAFGLAWHPLGDLHVVRGYALLSRDPLLARRFTDAAGEMLSDLLGTTRGRSAHAH
ncbi:LysR family transcriptional regulator [Agromyces sp. H66]|uniref:LysR family transcriptional regulator n=1 Tax=Agromyces sp. H66 TaxID=2529859 RepID=UPI00145BF09C|nr:LysR family transcriptional regulator [Agromyces sp. H66]